MQIIQHFFPNYDYVLKYEQILKGVLPEKEKKIPLYYVLNCASIDEWIL